MKKFNLIYLVALFVCTSQAYAQNFKFGEVSKAELDERINPSDSSAVAAYLYKNRRTWFEYLNGDGFVLRTEIHERIKIYKKEGFDYATQKIKLYNDGSTKETVQQLKAVTYTFENGKIMSAKLGKEGEFSTRINDNWNEESFTMPNIKEGAVIEYKYTIASPFVSNVDEFVFQNDIPIKRLEASIEVPEYFIFRLNGKGFLNVTPKYEKTNRTLNLAQRVQADSGTAARTQQQTSTVNYTALKTFYEMDNVPALKNEPFVNGIENYRSGMKYELSSTNFPNTPIKQYSATWEAVVKTIYENQSFGGELKKTGYYENDISPLIGSTSSNMDKLSIIFEFVRSRVKWNGIYGKYTNDGVKKAYADRVGNVAEINLMLTSMLNYAGLDANPVLVSTRNNGIPLFPTREGYNYVISSVVVGENTLLLDATHQFSTLNVLPFRTLNWEGRIIKKDGSSSTIDLYPQENSLTRVFMNATLSADGSITGKVRNSYEDHSGMNFRVDYVDEGEEEYIAKLEKTNQNIEIDSIEVKNLKTLDKPALITYDFFMDKGLDIIADKMYFSPLLFMATTVNPFTSDTREFPIDFGYPSSLDQVCTLVLPEGYAMEGAPESIALTMPDNLGSFKYEIKSSDKNIQVKVTSRINQPIIPAEYYTTVKEFYKKMIEKMSEKVVLSKV